MTHDKRFSSAEASLLWLVVKRDTIGDAGSVTGKIVRNGELGTAPDGSVFGESMEDQVHAMRDLEMVMDTGMGNMQKKVLAMYLDAECVRTYPMDENGEREPGAVDMIVAWRKRSRQRANRLISKMLGVVEQNLWRFDMLYNNPNPTRGDIQLTAVDEEAGVRAVRQVVTEEDLEAAAEYYDEEDLDGIEIVRTGASCH
jgi:hypothetical protein